MSTLPTLEWIKEQLDVKYAKAPFDAAMLRLRSPGLSPARVQSIEKQLRVSLPPIFRSVITAYGIGGLALGGVSFGSGPDYDAFLLQKNLSYADFTWWGPGERPPELLVAMSDGYSLLLSSHAEPIRAFRHGAAGDSHVIARDFEVFLRGLGLLFLERRRERIEILAAEVAVILGAETESFWTEYATGVT